MKHELPKLGYEYSALEPFIDAATMEIHHSKHHATYVAKLNEALDKHPELYDKSLEDLLASLDIVPEDISVPIRNHGGGHFNHSLFWTMLKKDKEPLGIESFLQPDFSSLDDFKAKFIAAGISHFGSGWVWLVRDKDRKLKIITLPNQDAPISLGLTPILGLDLWEHAYYLKFQNRRAEYIENWWQVINWEEVLRRLEM